MIVCVCNAVNERQIRRAIAAGHDTLDALQFELGVGSCCGKCIATACAVIDKETACLTEGEAEAVTHHPLHFMPSLRNAASAPALA